MILELIIYIFVAVLGLCIGSFLNAVIYRLEVEKSLKGRSFCPHCEHTLSWLDLFPVFSFLFLGGKCRYCKKKISWQYPVVELATGLVFLLILNFKFEILNQFEIYKFLNLAFLFYIAGAMIIIFVYDLKHSLIPDKVLLPAIGIMLIYDAINYHQILNNFMAAIVAGGFFLLIFLFSKGRAMGFGDVKLAVLMGLLLGFPKILVALFLAFFFGAIIGLILIAWQKKGLKSEISFGPFLIMGTFIALFWGSQLISFYVHLFQI